MYSFDHQIESAVWIKVFFSVKELSLIFFFFKHAEIFTGGASLTNKNSNNTEVLRGILSIIIEEIFADFVATKLKSSSGIELHWDYSELN